MTRLKEWLVAHLPAWLIPLNPWGNKGRPEMPEKHEVVNRQQAASLRIDRLEQRASLERWRDEHRRD